MSEALIAQLRDIEHFKDLPAKEFDRVVSITHSLRSISLFDSLSDQELAIIAEKGKRVSFERGDVIIHYGDTGKTFYIILKGQVRVWKKDHDKPRLLNYHTAGDFFGELAPLKDQPRAANVDVVEDVELIAFEPEGFDLITQHVQIGQYLRYWGQERIDRSNQDFEGKQWDEIAVVLAHKSLFALFRVICFPMAVIVLTLATWVLLFVFAQVSFSIILSIVIAIVVGMGLWIFWMWEDWRNDDFIVTSKRIVHIERIMVPPFPVERHEASIEQVQDITTQNHGVWTLLFNMRTLEIKTASAGVIQFPYVSDADEIREEIFRARDLARTRSAGEESGRIKQRLFEELDRPVKEVMALDGGEELRVTPERHGLLRLMDYFVPHTRIVQRNQIIWRKHWLILLGDVGPTILALIVSLALLIISFIRPSILSRLPLYSTVPLPALLTLISFGWYLWRYDGWRNDIYIVTNTRLVDIEGSPFHFQKESRTEGTFDVIQSTDYSSPNWFFRVLRIGNVTIDTAAEQKAFTFDSVAHPEQVQQEIFKRLAAFRERKKWEESERRYAEFTKWFGTYHRSIIEQDEQEE